MAKPKKSSNRSQSHADRRARGREQVAIWIHAEDRKRIDKLGDRWGMSFQRDVIVRALELAAKGTE